MTNKMYETEKQNTLLEKELHTLRSEYERQQMTKEQVEQLQQKMVVSNNL